MRSKTSKLKGGKGNYINAMKNQIKIFLEHNKLDKEFKKLKGHIPRKLDEIQNKTSLEKERHPEKSMVYMEDF